MTCAFGWVRTNFRTTPCQLSSSYPNSPTKTTILYYDFNTPITINPPA